MARWLIILAVLGLAAPADAQVFKPKGKKTESSEKKPAKKAKKAGKKKASTKARKSRRASDDGDSESSSKKVDPDHVKITDDDEIE